MNTPPKSVIHINFVVGALIFDARPIWSALRVAEQKGRVTLQTAESIQRKFGRTAIHLGTRHYLLRLAVDELSAALVDVYKLVPGQGPPTVDGFRVVGGPEWNRERDRALAAVEMFLYEFRAFLELLAKFSFGVLKEIGNLPASAKLLNGKVIRISTKSGSVRSHEFLQYMCEQLGLSVDWFAFLTDHRNFFTHEGAPYCAIEDRQTTVPEYDLLVMRENIHDFTKARPEDYFRASECQAVVSGIVALSGALQNHVISLLEK